MEAILSSISRSSTKTKSNLLRTTHYSKELRNVNKDGYTLILKTIVGENGEYQLSERRLHDRKELWFPYLVCKNNEFFVYINLVPRVSLLCLHCRWEKTMEAEKRDPGNEVACICHGRLFSINIQYQHFFSVVQSPFNSWHSSFSPTTFFEIGVCSGVSKTQASKTQTSDPLGVSKTQTLKTQTLWCLEN